MARSNCRRAAAETAGDSAVAGAALTTRRDRPIHVVEAHRWTHLEDEMNHGNDFGWKTVLFTSEALMAAALGGGVAIVLALVLDLL